MARFTVFFICLGLFSCSQFGRKEVKPQKPAAHLSPKQIQELNEKTAQRVSAQLKELAVAAKASGEEKVRFLASDMFLKASAAQMEGDFRTSNLIFERLVELVPEDPFILKKYAVGLIRAGELEQSLAILESLYKKRGSSDVGLVLAGVHSSLGKLKQARLVYMKILAKEPTNQDACIFLSKTHMLDKSHSKAKRVLQDCEKRDKGKGIYSYYIGKMMVDKGELEKAKKYFRKSAKIQPDFSQATLALGLASEEQGNKKEAANIYKKYLKSKPNDTLVLSRLVQLMFSMEKFREATPFAERLSDLDPEDLNLKVKLGILYTDAKEYRKAISTFKELLVKAPKNDKILYYLGAIYQEIKEFENSVDFFTRVPSSSGLYQDSSLQAAQMLSSLALRDEEKFQSKFLSHVSAMAKELPEMEIEFQVIKAGYFENLEENGRAIEAMEKVASKENFTDNHKYYLASLYEKEGRYEDVLPLIQSILKKNPGDAYAYNFLGYSLLEKGERFDEAYDYIAKAIELKPDDGYIRDSLGWYYYKTGDMEKALTELQKAAELVPDDVSIQKHLAIVYGKLKRFEKARKFIETAIGLAQYETERQELIQVLKSLKSERLPASN